MLIEYDKEGTMHTTLSTKAARRTVGGCVSLVGAAILAQGALAGGEPKNESPFTRPVGDRTTQAASPTADATAPSGQGEAKNEYPFTARIAIASGSDGSSFSWTDAALGGLVGVSICIAGVGGTRLTRHRVPRTA